MENQSSTPPEYPPLSKSSRFNLKFMWNVNKLSIAIFVIAILIKLISKLF
jgi:hypothetical protein